MKCSVKFAGLFLKVALCGVLIMPSSHALSLKIKKAVEKQKREYLKPYKSTRKPANWGKTIVPDGSHIMLRYSIVNGDSAIDEADQVKVKIKGLLSSSSATQEIKDFDLEIDGGSLAPKIVKISSSEVNKLVSGKNNFPEDFKFEAQVSQGENSAGKKADRLDYILLASTPAEFLYDVQSKNGNKVTLLVEVFYDN